MPYGDLWTDSTDLGNVFVTQSPSVTAAEKMNNSQLWTAVYTPNYTWSVSQQHPGLAEIALTYQNTLEIENYLLNLEAVSHSTYCDSLSPLQESLLRSGHHTDVSACLSFIEPMKWLPNVGTMLKEEPMLGLNKVNNLTLKCDHICFATVHLKSSRCCTTHDYSGVP